MKTSPTEKRNIMILAAAAMCVLAAADLSVPAQSSRSMPSLGRRVDEINRQSEKLERDRLNREMKGRTGNAENARKNRALNARIKEDLEGIQSAYNRIVAQLNTGGQLQDDFVVQIAGNVKKHAERLKISLALPAPAVEEEEGASREEDPVEDTRQSLKALCRDIFELVTNPVFEKPAVLDIEQGTKLRRDLEKIILHSEAIRKAREKAAG